MLGRLVMRFLGMGNDAADPPEAVVDRAERESAKADVAVDVDLDSDEDETEQWIDDAEPGMRMNSVLTADARHAGRSVWVPEEEGPEVWSLASVVAVSDDGMSYVVKAAAGDDGDQRQVPIQSCAEYDPSHALDLADASRMNQMHEAPLLNLLNRRFRDDTIYTNVGDVLISINPYSYIRGLYEIPMPVLPSPVSVDESVTDCGQKTSSDSDPEFESVSGSDSDNEAGPGIEEDPAAYPQTQYLSVSERTAALFRDYEENAKPKYTDKIDIDFPRMKKMESANTADTIDAADAADAAVVEVVEEPEEEDSPEDKLAALKRLLGRPHVYGVADRAFRYMTETGGGEVNGRFREMDQSIIITGESGAGKTEASKHVMRFLVTASRALGGPVASRRKGTSSRAASAAANAAAKRIEDALMQSNTVLEAFGNAKTVRNDNSSRFGKYIKLLYDGDFRLVGAKTEHFLLEKSRLVSLDAKERTYHIFYQVANALPRKAKVELSLNRAADSFAILNQGDCMEAADDVDDRAEFRAVDQALTDLGFTSEEKTDVWGLIAAILHSGQVRFKDLSDQEQRCRIVEDASTSVSLGRLASLWGVDQEVFETRVTRRTVAAGDASAYVTLNAAQSKENLMALLKHVYRQLFSWINWKINLVFQAPGAVLGGEERGVERSFIGILDIFGFEIVNTNSFEQLCINYANEVLQRQFNEHIFVREQEAYGLEGLDVDSIPFRDNEDIIKLISKRPDGLMPIMEDQALTGRQSAVPLDQAIFTDKNLLDLFHQRHDRMSPHPRYKKPRFAGSEFIVMHYAGEVTYCITGFLEKNNDTLHEDLRALLLSSRIPFLRKLIVGEEGKFDEGALLQVPGDSAKASGVYHQKLNAGSSGGITRLDGLARGLSSDSASGPPRPLLRRSSCSRIAAKVTVSNSFRRQLDDLVAQLGRTEPHYIKCIKPNPDKTPGGWHSPLVIEQLRYSGVLEVVRIRRDAYPIRASYKQFQRRFGELGRRWRQEGTRAVSTKRLSLDEAKSACLEIMEAVLGEQGIGAPYQAGKDKVFLREDGLQRLRAALQQHYSEAALKVQAIWRGWAARSRLAREGAAATVIQGAARGRLARRRARDLRQALLVAQAVSRMQQRKRDLERQELAARHVQKAWRGWHARSLRERESSIALLQAVARGYMARQHKAREDSGAIVQVRIAAVARGYIARKRYGSYLKSVVRIQAMWRANRQRVRFQAKREAASKIQGLVRGRTTRLAVREMIGKVVKIQALGRKYVERAIYSRKQAAAPRIQRCVRAFLRNARLRLRSMEMFHAARSGDVQGLARQLSEWPELLFLRDRYDLKINDGLGSNFVDDRHHDVHPDGLPSYATLLHAACQNGSLEIAVLLEPFSLDVAATDRWGNTSIHLAAAACNYDLLKLLARRANLDLAEAIRAAANGEQGPHPEAYPVGMSREAFALATAMVRRVRLADAAVPCMFQRRCNAGQEDGEGGRETGGKSAGNDPLQGPQGWIGSLGGEAGTAEEGRTIIAGYLKKRREMGVVHRRWVRVKQHWGTLGGEGESGPALCYYKKKTDRTPSKVILLHHCLLKRSERVDFAFELHSPLMIEGKNHEGRLYFAAEDELELQQWMVPLRVLVKFYDFKNKKRTSPMTFLDVHRRHALVGMRNKKGNTPLHLAATFEDHDEYDEPGLESRNAMECIVTCVVAWLAENGANPNAYNDDGETPMHIAARTGHFLATAQLELRGGDLRLPRKKDGKTVTELEGWQGKVGRRDVVAKGHMGWSEPATVEVCPLLPPPSKLFGFTYVSVFLERLTVPSTARISKPSLIVSVFSSKGQLVEVGQEIMSPALIFPTHTWWAKTWHMRTPLETLGAGSWVVFELRDCEMSPPVPPASSTSTSTSTSTWKSSGNTRGPVVYWGALALDEDKLDTQPETLTSFLPPADPARLSLSCKNVSSSSSSSSSSEGNRVLPSVQNDEDGGAGALPKAGATFTVDVSLTRMEVGMMSHMGDSRGTGPMPYGLQLSDRARFHPSINDTSGISAGDGREDGDHGGEQGPTGAVVGLPPDR